MDGPQIAALISVALVLAAMACIARLYSLGLISKYPAFLFFLVSQILTTIASKLTGLSSEAYAWAYLALLVLEWFAYGMMIRELYDSIFSEYPGIAFLGRWSVYLTLTVTFGYIVSGWVLAQQKAAELGTLVIKVEFASHCLLFGFAASILIVLIAISRYPLSLHSNIFANCVLFSIVLLSEMAGLVAEQFTSRHFTVPLNLAETLIGFVCLAVWPLLLSRENQIVLIFNRRGDRGIERSLLAQLDFLNAFLMRMAGK